MVHFQYAYYQSYQVIYLVYASRFASLYSKLYDKKAINCHQKQQNCWDQAVYWWVQNVERYEKPT